MFQFSAPKSFTLVAILTVGASFATAQLTAPHLLAGNMLAFASHQGEQQNASCHTTTNLPLAGTHWQQSQDPNDWHAARWIEFSAQGHGITGSDGCNRLMGSYSVDGNSIQLSGVASTMMACRDQGGNRKFVEAVQAATHFEICGTTLTLSSDHKKPIQLQAGQ